MSPDRLNQNPMKTITALDQNAQKTILGRLYNIIKYLIVMR